MSTATYTGVHEYKACFKVLNRRKYNSWKKFIQ